MSDAPTAPPKRKSKLAAAILFLCAAAFLSVTVVKQRLDRRPAQAPTGTPAPTFGGTWLSASDHEGVKIVAGTGHTILVDSTPPAATVWIDGARAGETPWAADLACVVGKRRVVEVKLAGYETSRYEIDCIEGSTHISTTLKRR